MALALKEQQNTGSVDLHLEWIEDLLVNYFDPMYQHQRKQKSDRIQYAGNASEIIDFLRTQNRQH